MLKILLNKLELFFFTQLNDFKHCNITVTIQHQSFVCTHTLLYLTLSGVTTQSEWTWEQWLWRGTPHSPNLQGWSLSIRWFKVISRTLIGVGSYPPAEMQSVYSTNPPDWSWFLVKTRQEKFDWLMLTAW